MYKLINGKIREERIRRKTFFFNGGPHAQKIK